MMAALNSMSAEIHRNGKLSEEKTPTFLRKSCDRLADITHEIGHNTARHMRELLLFDKSEIFALDYEAIAELIASSAKSEAREYELDGALSERLVGELSAFGDNIISAAVCGKAAQ